MHAYIGPVALALSVRNDTMFRWKRRCACRDVAFVTREPRRKVGNCEGQVPSSSWMKFYMKRYTSRRLLQVEGFPAQSTKFKMHTF